MIFNLIPVMFVGIAAHFLWKNYVSKLLDCPANNKSGESTQKNKDALAGSDEDEADINEYKLKLASPEPAQEWLDREYPKSGECQGNFNKENKGKKREEITNLKIIKTLKDHLDLRDFVNLKRLVCINSQISSLNVKGLICLESVMCHNNKINELDLSSNVKLKYLNCSRNQIKKIDLSNTNLEHLFCLENPSLQEVKGLDKCKLKSVPLNLVGGLREERKEKACGSGNYIDRTKKILGEYKELIKKEVEAHQRIIDSSDVFNESEKGESNSKKREYQVQIEQVDNLINKWK